MRFLPYAAGLLAGLASAAAGVAADPTRLLAPDDPAYDSGWRPPASPVAGLKAYRPVDAKDWLKLNQSTSGGMGAMPGMPGMKANKMKDMPGMKLPGMEHGK